MSCNRSQSPLKSLPFDIIHTLFDFTPFKDLVNFCSTCKALREHLANDSLWTRVCATYGLRDFTHFGGVTPFTVYTKLIVPYAPILGLWANDHPIRGSVMEFRLFAGDENEQGGIIGETWSFATQVDRNPLPPSYIRATKITFESDPTQEAQAAESLNRTAESVSDTRPKVRVFCYSDPSTPSTRHPATLYVRAETTTRYHLQFYRRTDEVPTFPPSDFIGYDEGPRLPRLPEQPECEVDHSSLIKIYPATRLPLFWAAPSPIRKPPAMSIRCSQDTESRPCPSAALHTPPIPYGSLDRRPPRYYPMKRTILPGVDPRSPEWTLQSLEGLWYGPCGLHGTQLVYAYVLEERPDQVHAIKLAGDSACPSGFLSWALNIQEEGSANGQATREHWTAALQVAGSSTADPAVLSPARILHGAAFVGIGRNRAIHLTVGGLIDADELQIFWSNTFHTFRRYKGRDVRP